MRIGIISDIHENFHNLFLALDRFETEGVDYILCLGDLMNPGIAKVMAAQPIPVHLIWGNNDGEKVDITMSSCATGSSLSVALSTYDFIDLGNRKIFATHYDDLALPMAKSGDFDLVCYGHNHLKAKSQEGNCIVLNPGELAASKTGRATCAIYDTNSHEATIIELEDSISLKSDFADAKLSQYLDRFTKRTQSAMQ